MSTTMDQHCSPDLEDQPHRRADIADAARTALTERGACVVRLGMFGTPEVVSRVYKRDDEQPIKHRRIAWSRATCMFNSDSEADFYVVTRDLRDLTVWNGLHSDLGAYPIENASQHRGAPR